MGSIQDFPLRYRTLNESINRLGREIPSTISAFMKLHESSTTTGALTTKTKELAALGMAICVRCDGCIAYHVHDAIQAGASRDEILEIISVAILMGGGPSVVYGAEAFEALNQFRAEPVAG
ncbi:MAG: carboxymuconolactone decarboxylase family protein [Rhodothermia bacterium]|nr:carboxymuconolactone decarboxylase family protein [Rhodothermia bacterium]